MAFIDIIAADAEFALRSENPKHAAAMMLTFHQRFAGFADGEDAPDPDDCTGLELREDGFALSFGDRNLHYARTGRGDRWFVSDSFVDRPEVGDRHDVAVTRFGAPYAFLEGISYCMECYRASHSRSTLKALVDEIADAMRKLEQVKGAINYCISQHRELGENLLDKQERLRTEPFLDICMAKATASLASSESPPPPPAATVSPEAARLVFKGVSGIYFLWKDDSIDYIGRANCIGSRLHPGHHRLKPHHRVSVVRMNRADSWVAEPYYIWWLRPTLNKEIQESSKASGFEESQEHELRDAIERIPLGAVIP